MNLDLQAFEYAISQIDDGEIFEIFAKQFLSYVLGHEFIPVGGTKDKGIDGYAHTFSVSKNEKTIFQLSTEQAHEGKIENTIQKLTENEVEYTRLFYVTNRKLNQTDRFVDVVYDKYNVVLTIFDLRWFVSNAAHDHRTIKHFQTFVDTYLHQYAKPGKITTVANLDNDARLYVFLGQQFDKKRADLKLDELLADTLILYSLEGTDPTIPKLKSIGEIKADISKYLKFDPRLLHDKIEQRLVVLSTKPRRINFHEKEQAYCLPFDTRVEIEQRNLQDEKLHEVFYEQTEKNIKKYFGELEVSVKDVKSLITSIFNSIFRKQGLDFSNFVLHGQNGNNSEQRLNDVINSAVDASSVIVKNKEKVKIALTLSVRDIVYNGTFEQQRYLKSLSNTYLMMFLLQWEPKISIYFQTLAAQMKVFVDNSIIIPAISEYYLTDNNKRHWNLLKSANAAGIELFINETLLDELVSHFRMIKSKYYSLFQKTENVYLGNEYELLYIDEILIRSYFYAKQRQQVFSFDDFINNFIDPSLDKAKSELITFLKEIFNIEFISNKAWDIKIDPDEKARLTEILADKKTSDVKAQNDAEMILAIYHLREKGGEDAKNGIFGYKTWWLSKDTNTYKAVSEAFGEKYPVSCYIRPDFIYNYITMTPSKNEVEDTYNEIFPTMLGVNLSYHISKDVVQTVQQKILDYNQKEPVRIKQILRSLSDKLKTDSKLAIRKNLELYLDEEFSKLDSGK